MSEAPLQSLIEDALELEELDVNMFRSRNALWVPIGSRGVFGGQVLGQALMACTKTVPDPFVVHSLHSYFLLAGDPQLPLLFQVESTRDGRSYITRTVRARQRGKCIFTMTVSFQRPEPYEFEHQLAPPAAPRPETLASEEDRLNQLLASPKLPAGIRTLVEERLTQPIPIEIKHTEPKVFLSGKPKDPQQMIWIKAKGDLGDASQMFHQVVVAYASDHVFLTTALLPHGLHSLHPKLRMMATLDHGMYFHATFRADEWLLYVMESPRTGGNRGLVIGRIYSLDGRLVASCIQEGVIRTKIASKL